MAKKRYFVLLPHCLLNPATRVHVLGHGFNLTQNITNYLLSKQIALIQLPCPEFTAMGYWRNPQGRQQYHNVFFRKHCRRELTPYVDMVVELIQNNHTPLCFLGIANSPTCAIFWRKHKLNRHQTESIIIEDSEGLGDSTFGVMTEVLHEMLLEQEIHLPFLEIPLRENIHSDAVKSFFSSLDDLLGVAPEYRKDVY